MEKDNETTYKKVARKKKPQSKTEQTVKAPETGERENEKNPKSTRREKRAKKKVLRGWIIFTVCLIAYALILMHYGNKLLKYTEECLDKYEASQSIYYMENYFKEIKAEYDAGRVPEVIDLSGLVTRYEDIDWVKARYMEKYGGKTLSFKKAQDSYMTEKPQYVIYADDMPMLTVNLEGYDPEVILAILTVLKWRVAGVEQERFEIADHFYDITVPYGFTVLVDGAPISEEYLTDKTEDIEIFTYAEEYADLRPMRNYRIEHVRRDMDIQILDMQGQPAKTESDGTYFRADYEVLDKVPEEYRQIVLDMTQTWSLFMTDDLPGSAHGFNTVSKYLIKDSVYYTKAYEWASGYDITYTSKHTLLNPPFLDTKLTNFVKYSDTCFACHVYFDKHMILTVSTQHVVDTVDSTFIFVWYDDTDDGVDNPHWAIADMI